MEKFYVYQYIDPRNNIPFYVGKGMGNRAYQHRQNVSRKTRRTACVNYCANLVECGFEPIIQIIAENLSEVDAHQLEKNMIAVIGRIGFELGGTLLNKSKGGKSNTGYRHTEETKKKLSEIRTGNTSHSEETRQLISKRTSEALMANTEARQKISDTHKGKPLKPEHKKKITDHLAKIKSDPDFYKRVIQTRTDNGNLKATKETKAKISKATIEAMQNPEVINKMKQSSAKRWSDPEEREKIAAKNSKTFQLTNRETGETFTISNLAKYCRDNKTYERKVHKQFIVERID